MGKLLVCLVTAVLAASGCTSEAPGQAMPTPGGTSAAPPTSTSTSRPGEAPPISSPGLDLTKYVSRVCDLLTVAQLEPFAIRSPGKPRDDVAGPVCSWNPPDTTAGARVTVDILSKAKNGWAGVYERKDGWAVFEEAGEVNGYPAVHVALTRIALNTGTCSTVVGVNREMVFDVIVFVLVRSSPEYTNPCPVSDRVASLVIDTLKGGR